MKAFNSLDDTFVISVLKKSLVCITALLVRLRPQSRNKNLAQSMVVILPSTFNLKEGLGKMTLLWPTKILGIYFSYSINLMNQQNYCQTITNIHGILKL